MRDYLSLSQIDKYERCPRAYFWGYVAEVWPPSADPLEFGKNYHAGVAAYHGGPETALRPDVKPLVAAYTGRFPPGADFVEKTFEVSFKNPDTGKDLGIKVKGVMDLGQDGWLIDHKTASRPYTQEIVDHAEQATIYSYAYRKVIGKKEKGIEYRVASKVYPKSKGRPPPIEIFRTTRGEEDYASLWCRMKEISLAIKEKKFEINFGGCFHPQYGKCPYFNICREVMLS